MPSPIKLILVFLLVGGLGYGAVANADTLYEIYKTKFGPPPIAEPVPDMTGYAPIPEVDLEAEAASGPFADGKTAYVCGVKDMMGWGETEIPLYYTWDGAPDDDKQAVTHYITHGQKAKILGHASHRGTRWYRIQTVAKFAVRGWVTANYLKANQPADVLHDKDWDAAIDRDKAANEERERQRLRDEEIRREAERRVGGG